MAKTVTAANYRDDPLYLRIKRAVDQILATSNFVAPVDVLVRMGLLEPMRLEDWRHGRVPYLERVVLGNLSRLSRTLRILRLHARDLNLKPSSTVYVRCGKGPKQRLRFTKTGDPNVEEAYSRHFVRPGKMTIPRADEVETPAGATPIDEASDVESQGSVQVPLDPACRRSAHLGSKTKSKQR